MVNPGFEQELARCRGYYEKSYGISSIEVSFIAFNCSGNGLGIIMGFLKKSSLSADNALLN